MPALTNTTTVEGLLSLIPELFDFTNSGTKQAQLDAMVQAAINDADSYLQVYLGTGYGGLTPAETAVQARGEAYLAASYLLDTVAFKKLTGTQYPLDSEESAAYQAYVVALEEKARDYLAKWFQVDVAGGEGGGKGTAFALPYFAATDSPVCEDDEDIQIRRIADEARSMPERIIGTVVA